MRSGLQAGWLGLSRSSNCKEEGQCAPLFQLTTGVAHFNDAAGQAYGVVATLLGDKCGEKAWQGALGQEPEGQVAAPLTPTLWRLPVVENELGPRR